jgi:hypothetical protein
MLVLAICRWAESCPRSCGRSFCFHAECFYVGRFHAELTDKQECEFVKSLPTIAKRSFAGAVLLVGLVYAGDYLLLRYRMAYPTAGAAFGNVVMERLYAIPQKNGATEYEFDARQPEVNTPCVHSLFPHLGLSPCWYLKRNSQKPIPMVIMPLERP